MVERMKYIAVRETFEGYIYFQDKKMPHKIHGASNESN